MQELILASTSPGRLRVLRDAGFPVRAVAPGVDERSVRDDDAVRRARALAEQKARAVAARAPDAWVIGADQVLRDGRALGGKPRDPDDHLAMLERLVGRAHDLVTGFAVVGPSWSHVGHAVTTMHVRADLTRGELEAYVASGEGSACAGGYAVEGRGAFLFERIEGDWFNVVGLPLLEVISVLRAHGWRHGGGS